MQRRYGNKGEIAGSKICGMNFFVRRPWIFRLIFRLSAMFCHSRHTHVPAHRLTVKARCRQIVHGLRKVQIHLTPDPPRMVSFCSDDPSEWDFTCYQKCRRDVLWASKSQNAWIMSGNISNCSLDHKEQKCQQGQICQMFRLRDIGQNRSGSKHFLKHLYSG